MLFALLAAGCGGGGDGQRKPGGAVLGATLNRCPVLTSFSAAPLETSVGSTIELSATAEDLDRDPVAFFWIAEDGPLDPCLAARASYRCSTLGEHRLNILVSDPHCLSRGAVTVTCRAVAAQGCGNGVREEGEGCDDGNLVDEDGCTARCQPEAFRDVPGPPTWARCQR
jgi:cysteine-rich repeat protein